MSISAKNSTDYHSLASNQPEFTGFDFVTSGKLVSLGYNTVDPSNTEITFSKTSGESSPFELSWFHAPETGWKAYGTFFLSSPGEYAMQWTGYINNSMIAQGTVTTNHIFESSMANFSDCSIDPPYPHKNYMYDTGALYYIISPDPALPEWHYQKVAEVTYSFNKEFYYPGDQGIFYVEVRPRDSRYYLPLAGVAFYLLRSATLDAVASGEARLFRSIKYSNETIRIGIPFQLSPEADPSDHRLIFSIATRDILSEGSINYHVLFEDLELVRQLSPSTTMLQAKVEASSQIAIQSFPFSTVVVSVELRNIGNVTFDGTLIIKGKTDYRSFAPAECAISNLGQNTVRDCSFYVAADDAGRYVFTVEVRTNQSLSVIELYEDSRFIDQGSSVTLTTSIYIYPLSDILTIIGIVLASMLAILAIFYRGRRAKPEIKIRRIRTIDPQDSSTEPAIELEIANEGKRDALGTNASMTLYDRTNCIMFHDILTLSFHDVVNSYRGGGKREVRDIRAGYRIWTYIRFDDLDPKYPDLHTREQYETECIAKLVIESGLFHTKEYFRYRFVSGHGIGKFGHDVRDFRQISSLRAFFGLLLCRKEKAR